MTQAASRPGHGTPAWVSLMVHDLPAAERFYGGVFDWEYSDGPTPLGPYLRAMKEGTPVAGLSAMAPRLQSPAAWLPHFAVQDADSAADVIRDGGGTVAVGPLEAAEEGRMAVVADTSGAVFSIWQPGDRHGLSFSHEAGAPAWGELITAETAMVSKFYEMVFDYEARTARTVPGTDRLTMYSGDRPVCGIRGVGEAVPADRGAHWLVHFAVQDVDAAAERVRELGGAVMNAVEETPIGRVVPVSDPEGAPFALRQPWT